MREKHKNEDLSKKLKKFLFIIISLFFEQKYINSSGIFIEKLRSSYQIFGDLFFT